MSERRALPVHVRDARCDAGEDLDHEALVHGKGRTLHAAQQRVGAVVDLGGGVGGRGGILSGLCCSSCTGACRPCRVCMQRPPPAANIMRLCAGSAGLFMFHTQPPSASHQQESVCLGALGPGKGGGVQPQHVGVAAQLRRGGGMRQVSSTWD